MRVLLLVRSSYWQVLYQSYCWCYSRASIEKVSGPSVKSDRYPTLCGFTHIHVGSRLVSRRIEFGKSWKTTQCHSVSSDVDVSMELHQSDNSLWITTWSGNDWVFCPHHHHHHHHRHNDDSYWFTVIIIINIIIIIVIMMILIGLQLGRTLGSSPTHRLSGQPPTLARAFCMNLWWWWGWSSTHTPLGKAL